MSDIDTETVPPKLLDRRWRSTTIGTVSLMWLISFVYLAVATAMPTAALSLDGVSLYALAFGGAMAASVVCTVVSGIWNDAAGPKWPMWTGMLLYVAGLMITGLAVTMPMLIAGRVLQGLGGGLISVSLYIVVSRVYPSSVRPKVFAAFATAWVVPAVMGPAITGIIVTWLNWRWVFLLIPVLAVPAALLLRPALNRSEGGTGVVPAGSGRLVGWAVTAAGCAGVFQLAGPLNNLLGLLLMMASLAGLLTAVPRLVPPGTFTALRGIPTVIAVRGLTSAAFICVEVFIPLLLTSRRGLSAVEVSVGITLGACSWALASWWQGRDQVTWTPARLIGYGTTSLTVGSALACLLVLPAVPVAVGFAGWLLCGVGMGLSYPTLSVLALDLSDEETKGRNTASLKLTETLFTAVAMSVTGSLFAALLPVNASVAFIACFGIALMAALLSRGIAYRAVPTAD